MPHKKAGLLQSMKTILSERKRIIFFFLTVTAAIIWRTLDNEHLPAALRIEEPNRPGLKMDPPGRAKHPIVMVPGFLTTGLEVWKALECTPNMTGSFRIRVTSPQMLMTMVSHPLCWMEHLMMCPDTGGDLTTHKLRAATGIEAGDYVVPGFWVWAKIVRNFADIGYDTNDLYFASYDWRLSAVMLEKRDSYFTKLMSQIEVMHATRKEKVVVISHSYGSVLSVKLFQIAGGAWVDKHVQAFINVGGPMLGMAKTVAGLLSGEMKDTVQMPSMARYFFDRHVSRGARVRMLRSWTSLHDMLPRGPVGLDVAGLPPHSLLAASKTPSGSRTLEAALSRFDNTTGPAELPVTSLLRVYCFYGVGKSTEVGYVYRPSLKESDVPYELVEVKEGDGDGTVPLVSLGYMCRKKWKKATTVEYAHKVIPTGIIADPRGGVATGDHVDIMGNFEMMEHVLRIVSGQDVGERVVSDIDERIRGM